MLRNPRWLRYDGYTINLDKDDFFRHPEHNKVEVFLSGSETPCVLNGITLSDIDYFLKHGKLPKGKKVNDRNNN
jgi:hypothetical protein